MNHPIDDHDRIENIDARLKEVERAQKTEPIKSIDVYQLLLQTNSKLDTIIQAQNGNNAKWDMLENSVQKVGRDLDAHAETWLKNTAREL